MNSILIIISSVGFLALLFVVMQGIQKLYYRSARRIYSVKAGGEDEHLRSVSRKEFLHPFETFRYKGRKINTSDYIVARVDGDCMSVRGIFSGNLVFIKEIKDNAPALKDKDILYIKYKLDGVVGYTLREYVEQDSNAEFVGTRYYTTEGRIKQNAPHHKRSDVVGVVKYCFE